MKRPLPKIRWTSRTNGSPAHFQNWLAENNLRSIAAGEEEMALHASALSPGDNRDLTHLSSAFDPEPRVGEIRLLSAEFSTQPERPVYVAILKQWDGEGMVTAIFSPFSYPALSTELQFPGRPHPLRTLCLWHHYVLPSEVLANSWCIDSLSDSELRDAWQVFRHAATDEPLPAPLAERVGTRIVSSDDPRLAWQQQEWALLKPLAQAALVWEEVKEEEIEKGFSPERQSRSRDFLDWLVGLPERLTEMLQPASLLAAADVNQGQPPCPPPLVFEIENVPFFLRFYAQRQDELLTVLVTDASQQISKVFDGYYLVFGGDDTKKVVIQSGKASLKVSPDKVVGKISFHTPDKRLVRTRPLE